MYFALQRRHVLAYPPFTLSLMRCGLHIKSFTLLKYYNLKCLLCLLRYFHLVNYTQLLIYIYSKFCLVYFSTVLVILNENEKLSKKNFFKQSTIAYSEVIFSLINRTFWASNRKGITCLFILLLL